MNLLLEWLTHALMGAIVAEWILGKKLGNVAMQWGALLGTAPDILESLPSIFLDTTRTLQWHQGPLHSLLAASLAAWALCPVAAKAWKKQKITRSTAFTWILATWTSHSLLDTLTLEGAAILWPLPLGSLPPRLSCNLILTFGPVPALLMAATLVPLLRLKTKKQQSHRQRLLIRGCGLTAAWLLFCLLAKLVSIAGFNADLHRRQTLASRTFESPVGLNLLLRRTVVQENSSFRIGYRSLLQPFSSPVRWTIYPADAPARIPLQTNESTDSTRRVLARHTDGWLLVRPHSRGLWIADLRHPEHRIWGEKKGMVDSRFPQTWNILADSRGDKLQRLHSNRHDPVDTTRRRVSRTFGNRTVWESNPRLAGVTGSLPECLTVED